MPKFTPEHLYQAASSGDIVVVCNILSEPSMERSSETLDKLLAGFAVVLHATGVRLQANGNRKLAIDILTKAYGCVRQVQLKTGEDYGTLATIACDLSNMYLEYVADLAAWGKTSYSTYKTMPVEAYRICFAALSTAHLIEHADKGRFLQVLTANQASAQQYLSPGAIEAYQVAATMPISSKAEMGLSKMLLATFDSELAEDPVKHHEQCVRRVSSEIAEGNFIALSHLLNHPSFAFTSINVDTLLLAVAKGIIRLGLKDKFLVLGEMKCDVVIDRSILFSNLLIAINCFRNIKNISPRDGVFLVDFLHLMTGFHIDLPTADITKVLTSWREAFEYCLPLMARFAHGDKSPDAKNFLPILESHLTFIPQVLPLISTAAAWGLSYYYALKHKDLSLFAAVGLQTGWEPDSLVTWVSDMMQNYRCLDVLNAPDSANILALACALNTTIVLIRDDSDTPIIVRPSCVTTREDSDAPPVIAHSSATPKMIYLGLNAKLGLYQILSPSMIVGALQPLQDRIARTRMTEFLYVPSLALDESIVNVVSSDLESVASSAAATPAQVNEDPAGLMYQAGCSGKLSIILPAMLQFAAARDVNTSSQLLAGLSAFFYGCGEQHMMASKKREMDAGEQFRNVLAASKYVHKKHGHMVADLVARAELHLKSMPKPSVFARIATAVSASGGSLSEILPICVEVSQEKFALNITRCDKLLRARANSLSVLNDREVDRWHENLNEAIDCLQQIKLKTFSDNLTLITVYNQLAKSHLENRKPFKAREACLLAQQMAEPLSLNGSALFKQSNAATLLLETSRLLQLINDKDKEGAANYSPRLFSPSAAVARDKGRVSSQADLSVLVKKPADKTKSADNGCSLPDIRPRALG